MFNSILMLIVSAVSFVQAIEHFTIEKYQDERDWPAIAQIIAGHTDLEWELTGHAQGTSRAMLKYWFQVTEVLRVDSKTIGFVNYRWWRGHFLTFFVRPWVSLYSIGIDKKYQHQGYGKVLLQHVIEQATNKYASAVTLATNVNNTVARHMFEQAGFTLAQIEYDVVANYDLTIDIPADKLPQGNIIQRHSGESLATLVAATVLAWEKLKVYWYRVPFRAPTSGIIPDVIIDWANPFNISSDSAPCA
jgi:ribosomal-protein-alanine N-acetyltransferase